MNDYTEFWMRAHAGKVSTSEYQEHFAGFHCSMDLPSSLYWKEIFQAFPEAKIILSTRDANAWYDSCASTILKMQKSPMQPWGIYIVQQVLPFWRKFARMMLVCWGEPFLQV